FVQNEDGVDLLTGDRSLNLYTIALNEVASNSSTCLLAKASSSQSCLWHQHLDTFSSVRRPKHIDVIRKKKGSSNTSNVDLSYVNHFNLNKNVKRYSRKNLMACNNSDTRSAFDCNNARNAFKMPFRKKPLDSLNIVQICIWIIDLGCSKHMKGNRALLTNFVEKFLETVRFEKNDFTVIAGYRDVVIGSMTRKKVYYVKVIVDDYSRYTWVFFLHSKDEASEVIIPFIKETQVNLQLQVQCVRTDNGTEFKNKTLAKFFDELMNKRKPNIKFFRVFGCRCYLLNDYEDVGKLKEKGDIGVFVGYSKESAAFRIYNNRTRKIQESVNVNFDDISKMASKQFSLEPGLSNLNKTGKSSNLSVSQMSETSKKDLEDLFHNFYDERSFYESSESFQEESSSSSLNGDVQQSPREVILPQTNTQSISNNMVPNVDEASTSHNVFNEHLEDAYFNPSTSFHDLSNVHTFYQSYPHEKKWTKDHPLHKIIGDLKSSVCKRGQLENVCLFLCLLSSIEPANVDEALRDAGWTAFLNGILKEEVYVGQPSGFVSKQYPDHVYAFDKALYGLKQTPQAWYVVLSQFFIDNGFQKVPTPMVEQAKLKLDLVGKPVDHTDYRNSGFDLTAYSDADHAGCYLDQKTEYEYVAVSSCCAQVLWMRTQLTDYGFFYDKVPIYCDSTSAIAISCNPERKTLEKAYYTQFGAPYQPGGQYRAAGPIFYQRNNENSSYPDRRQTMEESLTKFRAESAKRHEENSNIIKEIQASIDTAIKNQGALIKTLEILIGQTSKVLQGRGFGSLPSFTEINPRDHVNRFQLLKLIQLGYAVLDQDHMSYQTHRSVTYSLKHFHFLNDYMIIVVITGRRHVN
nr:hypothetical protein [Tanacetum cinerariifolium]